MPFRQVPLPCSHKPCDGPVAAWVLLIGIAPGAAALPHEIFADVGQLQAVADAATGLALARAATPPELLVLDGAAPGIDAPALCRQLQADAALRDIPCIVLGAPFGDDDGALVLQLGAADHLARPFGSAVLRARVSACLRQQRALALARGDNQRLREELAQRTAQLTVIQDVTTLVMASMAETRGAETSNHSRRTQYCVKALAWRLCTRPRFQPC